jgi:hypothetical protein
MGCSACGGVKSTSNVKITSTLKPQQKTSMLDVIKNIKIEKKPNAINPADNKTT